MMFYRYISENLTKYINKGEHDAGYKLFDDIDVNINKLGATVEKRNKKLASVLKNIAEMKLSYGDNTIDAFGFEL